jgi:hypothetical protein
MKPLYDLMQEKSRNRLATRYGNMLQDVGKPVHPRRDRHLAGAAAGGARTVSPLVLL